MTSRTVKKYADAARPEDLFTGQWQNRISLLDEYKTYLDDSWNDGCTNAWKLWEEIVPLGYKGSYQTVRAYLYKKHTSPRPVTARPPSPRAVAGWILRRSETLAETEHLRLKTVRANCPELDALTRHVRSFATMLSERQGQGEAGDDGVAVDARGEGAEAGKSSCGTASSQSGRHFGRARFQLLRKRVLLA